MGWYIDVIRHNYANFKGRARRKEYWMFILFNIIFAIVALIADNILGTTFKIGGAYSSFSLPYGWLYILYSLAVFIPGLAVTVRRLHDTGKSGGWIFIALIPIIGGIWLLVLLVTAGNPNANSYGPDPKSAS